MHPSTPIGRAVYQKMHNLLLSEASDDLYASSWFFMYLYNSVDGQIIPIVQTYMLTVN